MSKEHPDRFTTIAKDYAALWNEILEVGGFSYRDLQDSIFTCALELFGDLKNKRILDLGIGDGETILRFKEFGCTDLTGLDLNPTMLNACHERFGEGIKFIQGDVRELNKIVDPHTYDLIISGATFHNIPKSERIHVWDHLVLLKPHYIITGDKIADTNPTLHAKYLKDEMDAIVKVYKDNHGLVKESGDWIEHYIVDEREKLYQEEMEQALNKHFNTSLVFEMGMYKTVKCELL